MIQKKNNDKKIQMHDFDSRVKGLEFAANVMWTKDSGHVLDILLQQFDFMKTPLKPSDMMLLVGRTFQMGVMSCMRGQMNGTLNLIYKDEKDDGPGT